jgi:hypothetical protein
MLRLLVMLILALAHVRISARRATYGFILQQSQAAQPIAIESASLVDFSISFLQKKDGCPLSRGQQDSITVGWSGVLFERACPLNCPLTSPGPLSPLSSSQRDKRMASPLPVEKKHPHTYTPHAYQSQTKSPDPDLAYQSLTPSTHTRDH